ncbi:MAG: 2-oxoglutarate dehydrogenase E1 component [Acidobacteria bacterium]|nr:2-oxoglutarate dehydrogenase E1 component [Acidobacteriota bacterium]
MSEFTDQPGNLSLAFAEELYARYLVDPQSVSEDWRGYFDSLGNGAGESDSSSHTWAPGPSFQPPGVFRSATNGSALTTGIRAAQAVGPQDRVDKMARSHRVRGHTLASIDPLGLPRPSAPELDPAYHGLGPDDFGKPVSPRTLSGGGASTVGAVFRRLRNTYCRSIGVQFMHIDDEQVREWLQERMESTENRRELSRDQQLRILTQLTDAVMFEEFIQKKFVGAKSFSLEGSESLIPLLGLALEQAAADGIDEVVLGMAHRGRLNVLANVMGKSPQQIFREFEDVDPHLHDGQGDVKYHLGFSSDWQATTGRNVHLSLCFNPSHLEFVNPVALGRMRAKQDRHKDFERQRGLVILMHGDAAFAGEGIVQETLNMSELDGYTVGGTIHVIVNNQIGFTTSPDQSRSSAYASGLGKMLRIPIFHVNGEDPEAVAQIIHLAMEFRKTFKRDVVIDMYGYRRRGHNEGDEPRFTQPVLYRAISKRKTVREGYLEHLLTLEGVGREEADRIAEERRAHLEEELSAARSDDFVHRDQRSTGFWSGYKGGPEPRDDVETAVKRDRLSALLETLTRVPDDFQPDRRIKRLLNARREMGRGERPLDWATAESLAFATLAVEGFRIRLTGQDVERGTFSQRHAVVHDKEDGRPYVPLQHLTRSQAKVNIFNSPLSEAGVLGFEYGYSLDWPDGLILWEAQFGDFVNAAQVIIDQFISSAEDKWKRLSGLVMLLPHGFEGQGPEHSSARMERFLTQAAEENMQIVYPTTPAQYFHLLRRQVLRSWRKPLVVFTPKSLLRHSDAVSSLDDLSEGRFQRVIGESRVDYKSVNRVLLCTGKIYYELEAAREKAGRGNVAIIRVEQLYPLAESFLKKALSPVAEGTPVYWVQEEPKNMGAWHYMRIRFGERLFGKWPFSHISRPESASPATGSHAAHELEQKKIINQALGTSSLRT